MTYFMKQGADWFLTDTIPHVTSTLPVGTYMMQKSDGGELYLSEIDSFTLPEKTYGSEISRHDRIIKTFLSRPYTTGVILAGEKGAGKTLLSKRVSIELAEKHGIPTIVINSPFCGNEFSQFLQSITQPVLIILDEFEKVYSDEAQESLLTVLDGTMSSKKLFIVAVNKVHSINENMINRPGRFFYIFSYSGVSEDTIREFLEDNLHDKTQINTVVNYARLFRSFTFDMLAAITEEMNRYNEPVGEVLKYLNVSMEYGNGDFYEVVDVVIKNLEPGDIGWDRTSLEDTYDGVDFNAGRPYNPLLDEVSQTVYYLRKEEDYSEPRRCRSEYILTPADIVSIDRHGGFVFETDDIVMKIGKVKAKKAPHLDKLITQMG